MGKRGAWLATASVLAVTVVSPGSVARASACQPGTGSTIYVANFGDFTVSPVDVSCRTTQPAIKVGVSPTRVAITADGRRAYSLDFDSSDVTPIDTATNTARPKIVLVPNVFPQDMAMSPDGKTLYVTGDQDARGLIPIRTATRGVEPLIPVGGNPLAVAITPDGSTAYVALSGGRGSALRPVDLATGHLGPRVAVPLEVFRLAITPDGSTVYGMSDSGIVTISTATKTVTGTLAIKASYLEIMPDGRTAFVANSFTDTITELALPSGSVRHTLHLPSGSFPDGLAADPNGKTVYVSLGGADVVIPVSARTGVAGPAFGVGFEPFGLAVTPDQAPVASFSARGEGEGKGGGEGEVMILDASSSHAIQGRLRTYAWTFGDGTKAVTRAAVIRHRYHRPGTYNVTLRVTDNAGTSTARVYTGHLVSRNGGPAATAVHGITVS